MGESHKKYVLITFSVKKVPLEWTRRDWCVKDFFNERRRTEFESYDKRQIEKFLVRCYKFTAD